MEIFTVHHNDDGTAVVTDGQYSWTIAVAGLDALVGLEGADWEEGIDILDILGGDGLAMFTELCERVDDSRGVSSALDDWCI